MGAPKFPRHIYFKANPWVKEMRDELGHDFFDSRYRAIFKFVSSLLPGQYFYIKDLCKKDPDNHDLVLCLIDIFYNMDLFEDLEYDEETDKVTRLAPKTLVTRYPYRSVDMFSRIVKDPEAWGVDKDWI